jgi:hypothetical protein
MPRIRLDATVTANANISAVFPMAQARPDASREAKMPAARQADS